MQFHCRFLRQVYTIIVTDEGKQPTGRATGRAHTHACIMYMSTPATLQPPTIIGVKTA